MGELLHGAIELAKIIKDDPRIGWALLVLLVAGSVAAVLIHRFRRDAFLRIRK